MRPQTFPLASEGNGAANTRVRPAVDLEDSMVIDFDNIAFNVTCHSYSRKVIVWLSLLVCWGVPLTC